MWYASWLPRRQTLLKIEWSHGESSWYCFDFDTVCLSSIESSVKEGLERQSKGNMSMDPKVIDVPVISL